MNIKMTTNSQLATTESKKQQKETKQTTRTGTESQKWRSHGELLAGTGKGESGRKTQRLRNIIDRYKIDGDGG